MNTSAAVTLDVREILPRNRHPLIFGIFDVLPSGQALLLTNDHDPKPLYYQFQAESTGLLVGTISSKARIAGRCASARRRKRQSPHPRKAIAAAQRYKRVATPS